LTTRGLDPLGLYPIADALAEKLIPGVRERQSRIRFLTAAAVSLHVCSSFEQDAIATDGITEPWLAFEWYVVEGFVRRCNVEQTIGVPGRLKVAQAIDDGVPLSSRRYLKTPSVFGFHGIYRVLAHTLGIEQGGRLGESGLELLDIWSREQGLIGFFGTAIGPGQKEIQRIREAIKDTLDKAAVDRTAAWAGWDFFSQHLAIYDPRKSERQHLEKILLNDEIGHRTEVIMSLLSKQGQTDWKKNNSERKFHALLRIGASHELVCLLDVIAAYETFSRLCQDAFDDCLCEMTRSRRKVLPRELVRLPSVKLAAQRVPALFKELVEQLQPFDQALRYRDGFSLLAESGTAASWLEQLMKHHRKTQDLKPPDSKNSWVCQFDDGAFIIRPLYYRDQFGQHGDSYVHAYRTRPLWSFIRDLRLVRS
jgi:hypothetical protein